MSKNKSYYEIFDDRSDMIYLERSINSDYLYSLITALFYVHSSSINKIVDLEYINDDNPNLRLKNNNIYNVYYVREYIKHNLIYKLRDGLSINSKNLNILRMYLFRCGMIPNINNYLENYTVEYFYKFLICNMMNYKIKFELINTKTNEEQIKICPYLNISIDEESGRIINLTNCIGKWIENNIINDNVYFRFEEPPTIIPILINNNKNKYLNVMNNIQIISNTDKIQKNIIWSLMSLICKDENGKYYTIVKKQGDWIGFSENRQPSNFIVNMKDVYQVKSIMKQIVFLFYKIY
jgi:hypothetical protein